ncbi:MAG TPA: hypothetical protein VE891_07650, partial [Allosphingosinicella sp.]|nr:hypothetical protein [Allosphingosinicella sp.]
IENCGHGSCHPFEYSESVEIAAGDDFGNYSPKLPATEGSHFAVTPMLVGRKLAPRGRGPRADSISAENGLSRGAVSFNAFRSGRLLWKTPPLAPRQTALFRLEPTLWITLAADAREGENLSASAVASASAALRLGGVHSADIMMTGGGRGPNSGPIDFTLENVTKVG